MHCFSLGPEDRVVLAAAKFDAVVADYRRHPALLGYFICDEPNENYFKTLAAAVRHMRDIDPEHPALINLFPGYGSPLQLGFDDFRAYVHNFLKTVQPEVLSYDHYPLREAGHGESGWYEDLAVIRDEARQAMVPFWICLQSEGIGGYLRIPTKPEIFWQASTVLAYGARGVIWFT